jgi:amidase
VRSLADLVVFNESNAAVEQAGSGQYILASSLAAPTLNGEDYGSALALVRWTTREHGIDARLEKHFAEVLMGPTGPVSPRADRVSGDVRPVWAGAGSTAAVSGSPSLIAPTDTIAGVPMGFYV